VQKLQELTSPCVESVISALLNFLEDNRYKNYENFMKISNEGIASTKNEYFVESALESHDVTDEDDGLPCTPLSLSYRRISLDFARPRGATTVSVNWFERKTVISSDEHLSDICARLFVCFYIFRQPAWLVEKRRFFV
jgi:hypothetical protein